MLAGDSGGPDPEPEPEPGEPDLSSGLLYSLPAPTSVPIDLPNGTLIGVQTIAMVVKVPVTTGKHRKFCGCTSSQSAGQGALGIGVNPQGSLDVWRAGGGQQNPILPYPPFPAGQAVYLIWQQADAGQDLTLGVRGIQRRLAELLSPSPMVCASSAPATGQARRSILIEPGDEISYWKAWNRVLTAAEIEMLKDEMEPLTDEAPDPPVEPPINPPINPPGGGGNGELEPVDPGTHQVAITVENKPLQTIIGMGWGCNSALAGANSPAAIVLPRLKPHIKKVMGDIGATGIRVFTPEQHQNFMQYYKPYWDLARDHGATWAFSSSYIHTANPDAPVERVAEGIAAYRAAGVNIIGANLQNEPDAPNNHIPGASGTEVNAGNAAEVRARHKRFREALNQRGCQAVSVLDYEWRHPLHNGPPSFDHQREIIPSHVNGSCIHAYDTASSPMLYEDRWAKVGGVIWFTETGNNGSPSAQARYLGAMLHGAAVEIMHYVMIATPRPSNEQLGQSFLTWDGVPRPWLAGYGVIGLTMVPGSVVRLCRFERLAAADADGAGQTHVDTASAATSRAGGRCGRAGRQVARGSGQRDTRQRYAQRLCRWALRGSSAADHRVTARQDRCYVPRAAVRAAGWYYHHSQVGDAGRRDAVHSPGRGNSGANAGIRSWHRHCQPPRAIRREQCEGQMKGNDA